MKLFGVTYTCDRCGEKIGKFKSDKLSGVAMGRHICLKGRRSESL